jgi:hypothetical protein
MAFSIPNGASAAISGTSQTVTFSNACTPGSVIVVLVTSEGAAISGCSDPTNGAYTSPSGTGGVAATFYQANTSSSPLTITVTFSGSATAGIITLFEITSSAGTPVLDAHAEIPFQNDAPPNPNRSLTLTTTVSGAAGFACATAYPDAYIANPDSGWTAFVSGAAGSQRFHDSEYRANLGAAGAKTVWAAQGVDYAAVGMGMAAVAFREPSTLTKKWRVPVNTNGVTAELQVMTGTAAARSVIDQVSGVVSAGGFFKFNVTSPTSFSVGDKRLVFVHDWDGTTTEATFNSFGGIAEVIQE